MGNNKTLNSEYLYNLGIKSITQEITKLYDKHNNKFVLVLCPILTEEDKKNVEQENKLN
jgi:hypothetical protein